MAVIKPYPFSREIVPPNRARRPKISDPRETTSLRGIRIPSYVPPMNLSEINRRRRPQGRPPPPASRRPFAAGMRVARGARPALDDTIGADRARTGNLRVANAALSQLSYGPGLAGRVTPGQNPRNLTRRRVRSKRSRAHRGQQRPVAPKGRTSPTFRSQRARAQRSNGPDRIRTYDLILIRDAL